VLVGGPANHRVVALPDYAPEYKVALPPKAILIDPGEPPKTLAVRVGVYHRSGPPRSYNVMGEPLPYIYAGEETQP
jgi:hypothetical protein